MPENRPIRGLQPLRAEQELARKDPAFPGFGVLLDPELFSGLIRMHARTDPGHGRLVDLDYRPGVSCLATFVFGDDHDPIWVHGRALQPGERPPTGEDPPHLRSGLGFCRLPLDEYGLSVRAFPCDDGLPGLTSVADSGTRRDLLTELLPGRSVDGLTIRTVSYQPERRWLGAVEGSEGPLAALRIHAADAFAYARWNAESVHDGHGLTLPRLLGRSRERCATAVEWTSGRPLERALFDPALHEVELEGVGAAIAELHAQEAGNLPHCPPATGAPMVRTLASTLGFVLPRCAPRARKLGERLVRRLVDLSLENQPIHGSLEPAKLLLQGGGRVVMLDMDRACQGARGRDPGALVGHLERAAAAGQLSPERTAWAAEAILDGYDRTAPWPLRRRDVALHAALQLFELALQPFRKLIPEWPEHTMAILGRAEQVLGH